MVSKFFIISIFYNSSLFTKTLHTTNNFYFFIRKRKLLELYQNDFPSVVSIFKEMLHVDKKSYSGVKN